MSVNIAVAVYVLEHTVIGGMQDLRGFYSIMAHFWNISLIVSPSMYLLLTDSATLEAPENGRVKLLPPDSFTEPNEALSGHEWSIDTTMIGDVSF
jgi:hypothetical protein